MPRASTPKKEHPVREVLTNFDQAHRARFGKPYRVLKGRDPKTAKDLLEVPYTVDDLARWSKAFFESFDPFIRNSTYSFGVFSSCIGKLIAAESPRESLSPKSVRTLKAIYEQ